MFYFSNPSFEKGWYRFHYSFLSVLLLQEITIENLGMHESVKKSSSKLAFIHIKGEAHCAYVQIEECKGDK